MWELVRQGDGIAPKVLLLLAFWGWHSGSLGVHPCRLGGSTRKVGLLLCYKNYDILQSFPEIQLYNEPHTHIHKTDCFCRDWPLNRCLGPFLELALKIEQDIQKPSLWVQSSWRCLGGTKVCRENRGQESCSLPCQIREASCLHGGGGRPTALPVTGGYLKLFKCTRDLREKRFCWPLFFSQSQWLKISISLGSLLGWFAVVLFCASDNICKPVPLRHSPKIVNDNHNKNN